MSSDRREAAVRTRARQGRLGQLASPARLRAIGCAVAALCGLAATLAACGGDDTIDATQGLVLTNATVVDTRDGTLRPAQAVLVSNGKIDRIVASNRVRVSGSAQQVDASGRFVVPGFLDMHTHAQEVAVTDPGVWSLLVASGITGVRQMSGSAQQIAQARQHNADISAGRLDAPAILMVPGTIFAGQAGTDADARQFVQAQKAAGADFMKVVAGNATAISAVLDESRRVGLEVSGHLPVTVPAGELSAQGWRAIEHLGGTFGMMLDCSNDEAALRAAILTVRPPPLGLGGVTNARVFDANTYEPYFRSVQSTYDDGKCRALARTFVQNGTWHVPTLIRIRTMSFGADPAYRNDPNLQYVSKAVRALWSQLASDFGTSVQPLAAAALQDFYSLQQKVNGMLRRQGVKMLTGSDLSGVWLVPGVSLHQEFRELAASGLTPLEILQAATLNGAEFLGRQSEMGTVDEGKQANLVLLDGDPSLDVANLDRIHGVVLGGKYLSAAALETMKADVAQAYAAQPLKPASTAAIPAHVD
uniref:amidohydrolase family protein n=1 Tax=Cupriavidus yeoncheonensis TaxID=1462994 RepID=UPI003F495692